MGDNKGENTKKQSQQQQHLTVTPPKDNPVQESSTTEEQQQQAAVLVVSGSVPTFLSPPPPLYISGGETVNPKRPRYTSATGQWKLLPSPPSQQQKQQVVQVNLVGTTESTPSPSTQPPHTTSTAAASSSDTASSPSHSPRPSASASGQETSKPDTDQQYHQHQLRKGKYVSPVWKPNEMLWLARAWRVQYQGSVSAQSSRMDPQEGCDSDVAVAPSQHGRGKTRADKDKEVAEFLNQHGVNRDAKTAGTKWDNMLGEFRKVYEWERGGEREHCGKSYFRLSPYERKVQRLPASFDEEVFDELSQFMGSRMRSTSSRGASPFLPAADDARLALPDSKSFPPLPFRDDELPFSGRGRQLVMASGGGEGFIHGSRGTLLGFEGLPLEGVVGGNLHNATTSGSSSKELRRIGKIRMIWEELVSLWGEGGGDHHHHHQRGRIKVQGSSFLNADELTFLDESMVACTMEAFEDGYLKGFSVDRFVSGQQVKVFGRRKSYSTSMTTSGFNERAQPPSTEPSNRSLPPWEFQDPTDYYVGCLRVPPPTLPSLIELPWYLQEPPPDELRFPLRKDVYRDLPQGKELFFTTLSELLDCRAFTFDILSPIIRSNPSLTATTATCRESFVGLWDDCINRVVSKFCSLEIIFIRKPSCIAPDSVQDQWPNLTAFVRNFCLWRGEETDQLREGSNNNHHDPSSLIVEKLLWTYLDIPYILGYYAVGNIVTFCALSRTQDRIIRTDLHTVDLSTPGERIKALVPCWRLAGLLPLLADRCFNQISLKVFPYSDFERLDLGSGNIIELTPNLMTRFFSSKRKWATVKEIYDFLDHRIPHSEYITRSSEKDLSLTFKPRGCKFKPSNCDQLVECLKQVTKALVALHDLSFMHRALGWDKVMRRSDRENEWFLIGFDEAMSAPQIYPHGVVAGGVTAASGRHAPEMIGRGLHGVKVDVWGVGQLLKTCGLVGVPILLRELQNRCLDHNPEQRPTAADCYHHLLQLQSSMSTAGGY